MVCSDARRAGGGGRKVFEMARKNDFKIFSPSRVERSIHVKRKQGKVGAVVHIIVERTN